MAFAGVNVVIGGGQAGAIAVRAMRAAGFTGEIVLISNEPHLPYERPPLSKRILLAQSAPAPPALFDLAFYVENRVTLRLGAAAEELDRGRQRVLLDDGSRIAYDRLLLATGSRPRTLVLEGAGSLDLLYLRVFDDSVALRARLRDASSLLVIGGGFIGLEVAACATQLGCRAVVIEAAPTLLARLGCPIVSDFVAAFHRARGVDILLGERPLAIRREGRATAVALSTGESLCVDVVLVGVGVEPETRLAGAAGLFVDDGILTDEHCVTSDPQVFAAGDVACQRNSPLDPPVRRESWHNAQTQGLAAGRGMAGELVHCAEIPWVWSDQGDLNLQFAGDTARSEQVVLRGDPASGAFSVFFFDGARLIGAATVNQGRDMALIRRMLASGRHFAPAALADPDLRLRQLVA